MILSLIGRYLGRPARQNRVQRTILASVLSIWASSCMAGEDGPYCRVGEGYAPCGPRGLNLQPPDVWLSIDMNNVAGLRVLLNGKLALIKKEDILGLVANQPNSCRAPCRP